MMFTKKYPSLSFAENFLDGHINIGSITIYGENAMHWAINIKTSKWGYVCFRLPFLCFGKWWPLYFYCSPNGTPWASTFYLGPDKIQKIMSHVRRYLFGHNFSSNDDFSGWNRKFRDELERLHFLNQETRCH